MVNRGTGRASDGLGMPYTSRCLQLSLLPLDIMHFRDLGEMITNMCAEPLFLFPCLKKSSPFAKFLPERLISLGGKKAIRTGCSCLAIITGKTPSWITGQDKMQVPY